MNTQFVNLLYGLSDPKKESSINIILSRYKEGSAIDKKFYDSGTRIIEIRNKLLDEMKIDDIYLKALIQLEAASAFSIFKYILDDEYSDILIYHNGIHASNNRNGENFKIDSRIYKIYNIFLNHLVENIMFLSEQKFDAGNNRLDAEIQGMRFNAIHGSVIASGTPVLAIRKNLAKSNENLLGDNYIKSIGASEKQIEFIHKYAEKGTYIIFGEVGSGKTTLLRYMANYNLENKDNLCTIEDTKELNINVPLSELTNHHATIHDLFVNTLRQYPSHVIIGETRTDEIVDILENALTISVGTTIHAGSFYKALQRIVFMSMKRRLSSDDVLSLTNAAVDCFILMDKRKIKGMWIHKEGIHPNIYDAYEEIN